MNFGAVSTKTLRKIGLAHRLKVCYHVPMNTAQIAQAVNQALIEAMDNCAEFDWLPNMGYYNGYFMWA